MDDGTTIAMMLSLLGRMDGIEVFVGVAAVVVVVVSTNDDDDDVDDNVLIVLVVEVLVGRSSCSNRVG